LKNNAAEYGRGIFGAVRRIQTGLAIDKLIIIFNSVLSTPAHYIFEKEGQTLVLAFLFIVRAIFHVSAPKNPHNYRIFSPIFGI
jgi:hypothetical protein